MSGDFARWLENETAASLAHDIPRPADPFAAIHDSDAEYEGTVLELREPEDRGDEEG